MLLPKIYFSEYVRSGCVAKYVVQGPGVQHLNCFAESKIMQRFNI